MRLYYMTNQPCALLILKDRRMKISTIPELNDPFELLGASIGEAAMRRAMEILHPHWASTLGMICFTDDWGSPVMWAHYADKHYGLCLGFEVSDTPDEISEVSYVADRLRDLLDSEKPLFGMNEKIIRQILTTKHQDWAYEREFRIFVELKDQDADGRHYFEFGPILVLREVILGSRCRLSPRSVADTIGQSDRPIEIFKARPAFDRFRIVRDRDVEAIKVEPPRNPH
jgi:Protein of unknown function (DUF2971)